MGKQVKKCRKKQIIVLLMVSSLVIPQGIAGSGIPNSYAAIVQEDISADKEISYEVVTKQRDSVHDPSITVSKNASGEPVYHVFGSHMGVSKTTDLQNWTNVTGESETSPLFGDKNGTIVSYNKAFQENVLTGVQTLYKKDGTPYTVYFGNFDAAAYSTAVANPENGQPWSIQGNMWAPDVIYNKQMNKWCMYLSLNGTKWNSSIILLTSDKEEGPYIYQAPIIYSGFTADTSQVAANSYKNTDLEVVLGQQDSLPEKYNKISNNQWGEYWPHAIDPCVFYDEDDNLWMSYGSWSGGIYMIELDEKTGLRDYSASYTSDFEQKGKAVTSDEYFGKKIAGGYYVSGEGSYIEKIGEYYFLFMSYGFYSPTGGYEMRIFRSENPDGPYVDTTGKSAIFTQYALNYGSTAADTRGMKLMGNYRWNTMQVGEIAQGHNSALADESGKNYVIYHTKFDNGTAGHQLRVHQLYLNENGWIVAAPYEYADETISKTGYQKNDIVGEYEVIIHKYGVKVADQINGLTSSEVVEPVSIQLHSNGTITGAYTGTWQEKDGTNYAAIQLGNDTYLGVFCRQIIDETNIPVLCFSAVNEQTGVCIWGSHAMADRQCIDSAIKEITVPNATFTDLNLPTSGANGTQIVWTSNNLSILSNDGKVTTPTVDTTVQLTAKISKNSTYVEQIYPVLVYAINNQNGKLVASYFKNEPKNLASHLDGSLFVANPFYKDSNYGIDMTNGVTIKFDVESTGTNKVLATILSFLGKKGENGRLYFTPGSYLGYNANGGYFDANIKDYGIVTDYIGAKATVQIWLKPTGFSVSVNGKEDYTESILTTQYGSGTVTNYDDVLTWLKESADSLYFGYGSWWSAQGYDEAECTISNVECYIGIPSK